MELVIDGNKTFVATGGQDFDPTKPIVVMLHGAGFDHTTWALQTRWFAHHGYGMLAPDFPAHGRSEGNLLPTIEAMADWTAALLASVGADKGWIIGHSMGSLAALAFGARHSAMASRLSLVGTAATMAVGHDLLNAASANDPAAIDMVSIWGLGAKAELGGSLAPGAWMHAAAQRVLERCKPGVLFNDLSACNAYADALKSAATITVPTDIILGERDMMTPLKAGKALAAAIKTSQTVVLRSAGHMPMMECPDELLAALQAGRNRELS